MAQAQGSRVQLAYILEVTYGVTPGAPQTQAIEFSNFTGDLTTTQLSDPSIRADRQIAYSRRGNTSTEGELEVVMCADNYDTFLEAVTQGTWATGTLKIGTTQRSFAVEQGFTDLVQFRVFNGVVFNTLSMEVTPDKLVMAKFGLLGSSTTAFTGTPIDASPTAVTAKDKFFHEGGTFKEGGATVGYLSAISFELNNNVSTNVALGNTGVRSMSSGKANVTGKVTGWFEDVTLYNKFKNNTDSSIEFTLVAGAETLTFKLPKVKYGKGSIPMDGDGPITVELEFEAIYDTTDATTLMITRV